jgi:hypothetical protein
VLEAALKIAACGFAFLYRKENWSFGNSKKTFGTFGMFGQTITKPLSSLHSF